MGKPEASEQQGPHVPVLLAEVLAALAPLEGARILDGTFGAGGYSRALLEAGASVIAIDRDPTVAPIAQRLQEEFPSRFSFVEGTFSELDELAGGPVDGVVLDIGVSSMQLDEAERGFSFMREGPLDMRMSAEGESAADLVNTLEESELANLLYAFGEERKSRRIAHGIVAARARAPITTTTELARLIEKAIGRKPGEAHPATRSFQALRIAVNGELDQLVEGLFAAERLLGEDGRLAVVTFHSLEDRIVKRFFDPAKGAPTQSRHLPQVETEPLRWSPVDEGGEALGRRGGAQPARAVVDAALGSPHGRAGAGRQPCQSRGAADRRRPVIKTVNVLLFCTSLVGLVGVYALKYSVEDIASEKAALERKIERQQGELSLLQADWSYLNQPAHVAPIVARHQEALGLLPTRQEQFGRMDNLPMRPAAPDTVALDALLDSLDSGIDPIGQLIEAN